MTNIIADFLIGLFYAVPLAVSVVMFQYNAALKEKLPDKLPIHFNLRGEVNQWARKNFFWLFFNPVVLLSTSISIFICFHLLPYWNEGVVWKEFSLLGGLISVSLAYLMYRTNFLMMDYALGNRHNMFQELKVPLMVVIAVSFLPGGLVLMQGDAELVKTVTAGEVDEDYNAHDIRDTFYTREDSVYAWTKWENLNGDRTVTFEWYGPDGELHSKYEHGIGNRKHRRGPRVAYSDIRIREGDKPAGDSPGTWNVKIRLDDELVSSLDFRLIED